VRERASTACAAVRGRPPARPSPPPPQSRTSGCPRTWRPGPRRTSAAATRARSRTWRRVGGKGGRGGPQCAQGPRPLGSRVWRGRAASWEEPVCPHDPSARSLRRGAAAGPDEHRLGRVSAGARGRWGVGCLQPGWQPRADPPPPPPPSRHPVPRSFAYGITLWGEQRRAAWQHARVRTARGPAPPPACPSKPHPPSSAPLQSCSRADGRTRACRARCWDTSSAARAAGPPSRPPRRPATAAWRRPAGPRSRLRGAAARAIHLQRGL
jgi:hypothetical protein